jgi:hypothetical protein
VGCEKERLKRAKYDLSGIEDNSGHDKVPKLIHQFKNGCIVSVTNDPFL